ncbi:MAG TPA: hypothetical protein VK724_09775 [Bryobacteraceae bacterium]|jgi:hypothetical protein|nr:hypothetical protein [Bryobacteraceae bacterium]
MTVKYWAYLLLKLAAAGVVMRVVWLAIVAAFRGTIAYPAFEQKPFGHDLGFTTAMLLYFLACFGVLHLIIWDQRYRCRTCLRRLRMPVAAGSWPNMFLIGQPRTEYICLYGHGTLKVPEVQFTSKSTDWESHGDDIWKELESFEETKR